MATEAEKAAARKKSTLTLISLSVIAGGLTTGTGIALNHGHAATPATEGAMLALAVSFIILGIMGYCGLRKSKQAKAFLFSGMKDLVIGIFATAANIASLVGIATLSVTANQGHGWQIAMLALLVVIFYYSLKYQWILLSRINQGTEFERQGYIGDAPPVWLLFGRIFLVSKGLFLAVACAATARMLMASLQQSGARASVRVKEALTSNWQAVRLFGKTATIKNILVFAAVLKIAFFFSKRQWEEVLFCTKATASNSKWFNAYTYVTLNLAALVLTAGCAFGAYTLLAGPQPPKGTTTQEAEPANPADKDSRACGNQAEAPVTS